MASPTEELESQLRALKVLIVDDEPYTRKVVRSLLIGIGIKTTYEAGDGIEGLETLRSMAADVVLLDWEMPFLDGAEFMRLLRSPGSFPLPDVPVIMLTGHAERSRVTAAVKLGINEYLLKPVSTQQLRSRIESILINPRPMVRVGSYYGPQPRKLSTYKANSDFTNVVMMS
jgi:two-component system, chemotaxis family, chemotaxis protein CheY